MTVSGEGKWPPAHIRRGLIRAYVFVSVIWIGACGYAAYQAHKTAGLLQAEFGELYQNPATRDSNKAFEVLLELSTTGIEKMAAIYRMPLVPVGLPIVAIAVLWVVRGFVNRQP